MWKYIFLPNFLDNLPTLNYSNLCNKPGHESRFNKKPRIRDWSVSNYEYEAPIFFFLYNVEVSWPIMKPITVRAAVRRVANIRNLNLQMIPYKRLTIFGIFYFIIYILWMTIPNSMRLTSCLAKDCAANTRLFEHWGPFQEMGCFFESENFCRSCIWS